MELTTREMASGCIKNIDIQEKQLEVRIPPGVVSGSKLCLPASKTQGLGDIKLGIVLRVSDDTEENIYISKDLNICMESTNIKSITGKQLLVLPKDMNRGI